MKNIAEKTSEAAKQNMMRYWPEDIVERFSDTLDWTVLCDVLQLTSDGQQLHFSTNWDKTQAINARLLFESRIVEWMIEEKLVEAEHIKPLMEGILVDIFGDV